MSESVFDIFREEAREHLNALEKGFLDLESARLPEVRRSLIDNLFRHAHSLKGDARVVGLAALKEAAQSLEDLLDTLRCKPEEVDQLQIDDGLAQLDQVRAAFESWQQGSGTETPGHKAGPIAESEVVPAAQAQFPISTWNEQPAADLPPAVPRQVPSLATSIMSVVSEESFTVRVSAERLDRMLNLAGEVRISQRSTEAVQRRLADLAEHLGSAARDCSYEQRPAFEFALDQVRRVAGEIHNRSVNEELLVHGLETDIRQARLLPLLMLTDALRRAVRDLSQTLRKSIRYEADVGKILLDKAIIEALKDPLMHLIRNAADHGIEAPSARQLAGKSDEGVIRIAAVQQGPAVRITISDDGRGVDYERIRGRLRRMGELSDDEVQSLSDRELIAWLFKPGFTTVTAGDISGRGVGLDVVADTVRTLQGTVMLEHSSSAGTIFAITVPVTVSTIRVLTVTNGGQAYGIPSSAVLRTGRAKRSDLQMLEGAQVLNVDGAPLRWVHLSHLLAAAPSYQATESDAWSYLLVTQQGRQVAVAVDELEDESEVLLKPLGFPLGGLPGVFGATIRADGSVQLVLDLASGALTTAGQARSARPLDVKRARRIMVVDDSPTTRAVLRNVFTAAGFAVVTATDGIDALERLRTQAVDIVVSDIEMPRLNGFDLTRQIKAKFGLPVILVTGREREEHRREGLEAGADAYIIKSTFEGQGLLEIVEQFA